MCGLRYGSTEAVAATESMARPDRARGLSRLGRARRREGRLPALRQRKIPRRRDRRRRSTTEVRAAIAEHGIRNALLTSVAPTGTISLFADNVSSGIEPVFSFRYTRNVLMPDGTRREEEVERLRLPPVPPAQGRDGAAARLFRRRADARARGPSRHAGGGAAPHRQLDLEDDQPAGRHPVRPLQGCLCPRLCDGLQGLHDLSAERGHRRGARSAAGDGRS